MNRLKEKQTKFNRRKKSVRKNIVNKTDRPRITVFRSNKHISAQVINDLKHITITGHSDIKLRGKKGTKTEKASVVGEELAKKMKELKLVKAIFDRSGYKYHGRVKALADGLRKGGIEF